MSRLQINNTASKKPIYEDESSISKMFQHRLSEPNNNNNQNFAFKNRIQNLATNQRNGSPHSTKLNGSFMSTADVMPDGPKISHPISKQSSGFKSAQRSSNFIRAGNNISGSVNVEEARHKSNLKQISPPELLHQDISLGQQNYQLPNLSNLPTQYSSSRIDNKIGAGIVGNHSGSGGFGALRNSSNYMRNLSP